MLTLTPPPAALARRNAGGTAAALLRLTRPKQWTKNLFVLAPVVFAAKWTDPVVVAASGVAFLAFTLAAAAIYCLNDSLDVEADRRHPRKCRRPVAAGVISPVAALAFSGTLAAGSLTAAAALGSATAALLAVYLVLNLGYSLFWKHRPLIDVMCVAAGFVLRVAGGCAAVGVAPSAWLLLCTAFLALFLALVKRRSELVQSADPLAQRRVMAAYSLPLLDQLGRV